MDRVIYGNPVGAWLLAFAVALAVAAGLRLVVGTAARRLGVAVGRRTGQAENLVARLLSRTHGLFIVLVAFWAGARALTLPANIEEVARAALVIGFLLQTAFWGGAVIDHALNRYRRQLMEVDPSGATAVGILGFLARFALWTVIVLTALANLGINITAFIASLGIGGIAIALALQNVLGDLFASLAIVLDKPFVIGDFIIVGDLMGTVEHVGLKTTRIRSLSGEQLVFSNSDLLSSRIRNYKRMNERRVIFTVGTTYDTPLQLVREIPRIIREAVEAQENTRFDRSHFRSYGASALEFETVYYMLVPDYNAFMDTQEAVNLTILERFGREGIEFAFPTQTLHVHEARRADEPADEPAAAR